MPMHAARGVARTHQQGMDDGLFRRRQPLDEILVGIFVHEKADRAAVHAVSAFPSS